MIDKFWVFLGVFIDVSFTRVVIEIICTFVKTGCTHYFFFLITTNINAVA